ncbi:MAG: N-acetylmuramoyl-L-alanine amidase [Elusimicrobia bacterium]|nr:N-acetylmuramoyl-L-alanine amidase [Elusimicrobiota bacterium]
MSRLLRLVLLAVAAALPGAAAAAGSEIEVVKGGKYWGTVDSYAVGDDLYLGLKEAAKVYGAQLYWYAVKGQVTLTLRGRPVAFTEDSVDVSVDGRPVKLPRPLLVRVGRAFVPVEFFSDPACAEVAGLETKFNPKTRLMLVDQRSNVGPLRWFTYPDHTRVVLELGEGLRFESGPREVGGYQVGIPNGVIDWSERIDVGDGVLDAVHLTQDARQARLELSFQQGADGVVQKEFSEPRRLVIDVRRRPGSARDSAPLGATLPDAPLPAKPAEPKVVLKPAAPKALPAEAAKPAPPQAVETPKAAPAPAKPKAPERPLYRIAVDAGHGGKDGGTTGRRGTLEKDINLAAAMELAKLLQEEGRFEVNLVRQTDVFVKLGERSKMANEAGADLFISMHSNAHPSRAESGFEVYALAERASDPDAERLAEFENSVLELEGVEGKDAETAILVQLGRTEDMNLGLELAGLVQKQLASRVDLPNRGVKQAAFYILRNVNCPSVLVEMGFLSNERDEAKLESAKYRRRLVEGIYAGVVEYFNRRSPDDAEGR